MWLFYKKYIGIQFSTPPCRHYPSNVTLHFLSSRAKSFSLFLELGPAL